jgi:hypothetical protein
MARRVRLEPEPTAFAKLDRQKLDMKPLGRRFLSTRPTIDRRYPVSKPNVDAERENTWWPKAFIASTAAPAKAA